MNFFAWLNLLVKCCGLYNMWKVRVGVKKIQWNVSSYIMCDVLQFCMKIECMFHCINILCFCQFWLSFWESNLLLIQRNDWKRISKIFKYKKCNPLCGEIQCHMVVFFWIAWFLWLVSLHNINPPFIFIIIFFLLAHSENAVQYPLESYIKA